MPVDSNIQLVINEMTRAQAEENLESLNEKELIFLSDKSIPIPTEENVNQVMAVGEDGNYTLSKLRTINGESLIGEGNVKILSNNSVNAEENILWENPDPTAEFSSQIINLVENSCSLIIVETTHGNYTSYKTGITGFITAWSYKYNTSIQRSICLKDDNTIEFGDGTALEVAGGTEKALRNDLAIPTRIIGVKFSPNIAQDNYSLEEQVIGKWINGKTLYRKTIYVESLPNVVGGQIYEHNIENVDMAWFDTSNCFVKWSNGNTNQLSFLHPNTPDGSKEFRPSTIVLYDATKLSFTIGVGSDRSALSAYVTLKYTKTTD